MHLAERLAYLVLSFVSACATLIALSCTVVFGLSAFSPTGVLFFVLGCVALGAFLVGVPATAVLLYGIFVPDSARDQGLRRASRAGDSRV